MASMSHSLGRYDVYFKSVTKLANRAFYIQIRNEVAEGFGGEGSQDVGCIKCTTFLHGKVILMWVLGMFTILPSVLGSTLKTFHFHRKSLKLGAG